MKRRWNWTVCAVMATAGCLWAQVSPEVQETANQLTGSIYTGPSMTTLRDLSDGFGGRLTGSPAYNHAAEWAANQFRNYGIQNVKLEPFAMESGWVRGSAHGEIVSPAPRKLYLESLGWSPSTPAGGVSGELLIVDDVSKDALKAVLPKAKGKIIVYDLSKIFAHGWTKSLTLLMSSYQPLKDAGALGIVFPDRESNNVLNAHDPNWGSQLSVLPAAEIGMEDWALLRRDLEKGPVVIHFELQNQTSGPIQVNNVVAEIRGSEKPDEWILIGAHLDSWDFGTGAQDNGAGTAMVLEAARAIAALKKAPRRSIRFALWGGEEEGVLGSFAYTQLHLSEMAKCVAVLNTDNGSGHPKGWKVEGRPDMETAMKPLSDTLLKGLSGEGLSQEVSYDTDHGPFMLHGIPVLDLWVDMKPYFEIHHKASDTYDKVDPLFFKTDTAIVAVTAWAIANDPKPIAPHIDHAAVAEILKKAELDALLADVGVWKP
jgi:carboxypeptidase Q